MADETQDVQESGGLQGLYDNIGQGLRRIGHFWLPEFVNAPGALSAEEIRAQQAAQRAAELKAQEEARRMKEAFTVQQAGLEPGRPAVSRVNPWLDMERLFDHMELQKRRPEPNEAYLRQHKPEVIDRLNWDDLQRQFKQQAQDRPEEFVTAYKPIKGKPGKVESMPVYYPIPALQSYLSAANYAKQNGLLKDWSREDLAAMALEEGRYDLGHNWHDYKNPTVQNWYAKLIKKGFSPDAASFVATLEEKAAKAKRLNTNKFKEYNGSSAYVKRIEAARQALKHEKNQPFLEHMGLSYDTGKAKGGSVGKALEGNNKLI